MNQPLGNAVGYALEVKEAIESLRGGGPQDFVEHCLTAAAHMLLLGKIAMNLAEARFLAQQALTEGSAWERFRQLVAAQGGEMSYVDEPERLPSAPYVETVPAPRSGYISMIHARVVGETSVRLGAGRVKKGDAIDHAVGVEILRTVGDYLEAGEPLFTVHANNQSLLGEARQHLLEAHRWSDGPVAPLPLFYGEVTRDKSEGIEREGCYRTDWCARLRGYAKK